MSTLQHALSANARGFAVFPLGPKSKIPMPGSHGFKSASTRVQDIKDWWAKTPDANVGVACGESGLFVLDFDSENDIPRWLHEVRTLKVKTSRGVHFYFYGERASERIFVGGKHCGELKSNGGYVLGFGSVHPSGAAYEILDDSEIITAPAQVESLLQSPTTQKTPVDASVNGPKIPLRQHDTELHRIAGKLRSISMEEEAIYTTLVEICEKRCENYGTDYLEMCRKHAHNICKHAVPTEIDFTIGGKLPEDTIAAKSNDPQSATNATTAAPQEPEPFFTVNGDLFMKENIPPRQVLVRTISHGEPVFFGPSINQIFAWRGMGKTNLGFGLVAALSRGEKFLNWEAPTPVKVLYVEGELPAAQVQERWKQIIGTTNGQARLITIDKQTNNTMTSLATTQGMDRLEKTLATLEADGFKVQVLFLDSISTLFNVGANDEDTWIAIQAWFISLRSRGICIFFFHHAGKSGLSRSHSKSEDMLDVSIKLEAPKEPEPGCLHAVMTYDKARSGLSEAPAEIKMHRAHSEACECKQTGKLGCAGDSVTWLYEPAISIKKQQALGMFADGMTVRAVAKELRAPIGTINSWRTEWSGKEHATGVRGMKVNGISLDAVVPVASVTGEPEAVH